MTKDFHRLADHHDLSVFHHIIRSANKRNKLLRDKYVMNFILIIILVFKGKGISYCLIYVRRKLKNCNEPRDSDSIDRYNEISHPRKYPSTAGKVSDRENDVADKEVVSRRCRNRCRCSLRFSCLRDLSPCSHRRSSD